MDREGSSRCSKNSYKVMLKKRNKPHKETSRRTGEGCTWRWSAAQRVQVDRRPEHRGLSWRGKQTTVWRQASCMRFWFRLTSHRRSLAGITAPLLYKGQKVWRILTMTTWQSRMQPVTVRLPRPGSLPTTLSVCSWGWVKVDAVYLWTKPSVGETAVEKSRHCGWWVTE